LVMETDANGHETRYTYNSLDQKVSTRFHDGSTVSDEYDALSRKTASVDQNGTRTEYDYDALGRLTAVRQFLNGAPLTTLYSYDSQGNKLTQTDAEGRTTRWEYDALGRVTARILPLGQRETFEYDANGNQTRHTDFNGQLTTSEYDALNRLVRRSYADGTQEAWTYDAAGRVIETTLTTHGLPQVTHYQYDQQDRLTRETKPDGSVLEYSYDLNGNKTSVTVTPAGGSARTVNYSYDALNRLATATDEHGTTTYTYTPAGSRASVTQANGVTTSYSYDSLNRLTQLASRASNGTVLQQFDYTLDASGRRTRIEEHNGRVSAYVYDDLYRLVEEVISDPVNGNHQSLYQYDMVGNRTQATVNGVTTSYSYDANDRILSQGDTTYSYDANGNTLTESSSSGTTTYSWDARNRLIEATTPNSTLLFDYDINGIRTSRSENGITTNFVVDHNQQYAQVLAEMEAGTTTKQYTYGDDLLSQSEGAGQERFFLYDGLGTTRALADGSEAVTDTYVYEAFGELLASTGSSDNAYRYTGEQYDSGLDQYYLRARYYDHGVGRFTQMDSWKGRIGNPITLHKYLYTHANPVNGTDPTGMYNLMDISISNNGVALGARQATATSLRTAVKKSVTSTIKQSGKLFTQSIKQLRACIRKSNKCNLKANLLIVGGDNTELAQHIRDAQLPHTIVLTYERRKRGNRRWYKNHQECKFLKIGYQCDEYPFFATREGGPLRYPVAVSLRQVPARENMVVGGHFGFLARNMKSRDQFIVISDVSIPLTVALPLGKRK
ncbi:RHS repeat-associated core domain-containing protein, partial [Alcanivorax sp. 1008]|uniref:RHS repeat-associated core domain-containing protein n=1 Tax=Alcanivorax sp. 1008 TaxID=2816853 RepID=UPI001D774EAF